MRLPAIAIAAITLASSLGCEDVDWLWWQGTGQQRPAQPRRVIRRTAPTLTGRAPVRPPDAPERTDDVTEPATLASETPPPDPMTAPAAPARTTTGQTAAFSTRPSAPAPPPDGGDAFYQLLLLSEPTGAAAPDNVRQVQLRNARASEVGAIIESLYMPVGPGGTDDRYFLIYESPAVWVAAQEMCRYLDVPADLPLTPIAGDPAVAFEHALSRYYQLSRSGTPAEADARSLVSALSKSVLDASLDRPLQWTAAMLAGAACVDWLQDTEGAVQFYMLARNRSAAGSAEELMAGVKLADTHARAGDIAAAHQANLDLLSRSASLSSSFAYRRAHGRALEQETQLSKAGGR